MPEADILEDGLLPWLSDFVVANGGAYLLDNHQYNANGRSYKENCRNE